VTKVGRLVFSGWKLVAEEAKHPNSSYLPAMVASILGKRIPHHDDLILTAWYGYHEGREMWRTIHHKLAQSIATLLIIDSLDIVGRAGEASRLSGVEFSQSFPGIRGSQYKVEGVLLRALKSIQSDEVGHKRGATLNDRENQSVSSEGSSNNQSPWMLRRGMNSKRSDFQNHALNVSERNYFFYSPGVNDTNKQEALECQALTLEPQSGIHLDPVVVCDFTALYPSLIIAYNLCYSTIAGKLDYHSTRSEMRQEGRTTGKLGPFPYSEKRTATVLHHHVKSIMHNASKTVEGETLFHKDRSYASPTGAIYVSESVLKGVLPQVLDEILSTRAMLKKAAKYYKKKVPNLSPAILRQLEARQLALKYVANVTYGYTSATFSGRCALPLLADTIVECGRRTLTRAISLANKWGRERSNRWYGAEVIYGDTDSIFVKLPGRSIDEAFEFGEFFCSEVTAANPPPIQLKLEKVYKGSMMQTKKKYCGMKYESRDQRKPVYEAKGIETVRRDQCTLTQKVIRNTLVTLFRDGLQEVKAYLFRQWGLILGGHLPVSDFILTGRVRSKYRGGRVGPVQAVLARRLAEADPGRVIRHKERLAYVIVATPGCTFRLRDCVLTPNELLEQWDAYTIHSAYYIEKHVNAAIQRCLGLPPYYVNINTWFESCPKPRKRIHHWPVTKSGNSLMISSYFGSDICSLCGRKCRAEGRARAVVCSWCRLDFMKAGTEALKRLKEAQQSSSVVASKCSACNKCFEDASTFAVSKSLENRSSTILTSKQNPGIITPIANCTCIDCPNTFERHRLRESELEAHAVCQALDLM
jgi:DNA polymerase family B